ncbi:MAG: FmdB family transcriptional regulator [Chitinispirillaceae bacterium]|nr:FmdB family transcriptional regulator [Chitinispirillaceae bacterium]
MPTYEYECEKCGLRFEAFQSITAEPLARCKNEACDGRVKRLFSAGGGFIFKGSGFYITDYRSDSYKKAAQSESGASSPSTSGGAKKSDGTGSSTSSAGAASTSGNSSTAGGAASSGKSK